jgi:hypothetical protein
MTRKQIVVARPVRDPSTSYVKPKDRARQTTPPSSPSIEGGGEGVILGQAKKEKKTSNVESLLGQASTLSLEERKLLLARLSLGIHHGNASDPRDLDMWVVAVYDGLVSALGARDGVGVGPAAIKRALGAPAVWGPVSEFMASAKFNQIKVVERQAVYVLLAKLVIAQAKYVAGKTMAPLSARLVGNVATNVAGIFDQAFPGYLASGMAGIIVRRLTAVRDPA